MSRGTLSTPPSEVTLETALSSLPAQLRTKLLERYRDAKAAFVRSDYEACGLRVGKACEILIRVLQHVLTGSHTPLGQRIQNFSKECARLQNLPASAGDEGLRIIAPRALEFAYTLRNKRGFGHESGDVDANEIDAVAGLRALDWSIAELVRVLGSASLEEAQALLDAIAEREIAQIWSVAGKKRVLRPGLTYKEQTLLLLYSEVGEPVPVEELFAWTEHSHQPAYRRDVLVPLHRERLVEYDRDSETVQISPLGSMRCESELIPDLLATLGEPAGRRGLRKGTGRKGGRA